MRTDGRLRGLGAEACCLGGNSRGYKAVRGGAISQGERDQSLRRLGAPDLQGTWRQGRLGETRDLISEST